MPLPPFGLLPAPMPNDPGLVHATDHRERAIGVLLSQLRDKPRFTTLVDILTRPLQELEDVFWDLYTKRRIDSAAGVQLDLIGKIVNEARGGLLDDDYRAIVRIKVRVLFSRGNSEDLIRICKLFLTTDGFDFDEFWPAAIEVVVYESITLARLQLLRRFLKKAKSGGVRLDVVDGIGGTGARFHYGFVGDPDGAGFDVGTYGGVV